MRTLNTQPFDSDLLEQAKQLGGHQTEQETLNEALKEYIRWRKRIEEIQNFGTIDFEPDFLAEMDRRSQLIFLDTPVLSVSYRRKYREDRVKPYAIS